MKPRKIIYKNIVINEHNVNAFRAGRRLLYSGITNIPTRDIYIYRYSFDENLKLPRNDILRRNVEKITRDERKTLEHEKKHLANMDVNIDSFAKTYYELVMLHCLEEISARTTEFLIDSNINTRNVVRSMRRAAEQFVEIDYFNDDFLPKISDNIVNDLNNRGQYAIRNLNMQNAWYLEMSPKLYSEHFHILEQHFFTFGKFCVFDHLTNTILNSQDWHRYLMAVEKIRMDNMMQLYTTIRTILNMHYSVRLK